MADNFEQLGFQVKVDGANSAVSRLDDIINRLERINQLQGQKVVSSKQVVNSQKQEEKQTKINTKGLTSYIGKLTSTVVIARKFAHLVTDAVNESASYIENLNLFAVAYGNVYEETLDWVLNLADSFGLANNEVVRFAGTFRELSTSLGLVENTANAVSKTLTQLGYDLSALYNTSVEQAMEKLQSGIFSGNVRPLRSFGIDISQNQIDALFETNEALAGLGVNARNLSQADKVIARLVIALDSGADAFGTMYREINNLQSQFRIFQGSLSNFKLAIGDLVQKPIADAMVYINGFIIAMTNIIRTFIPLQKQDETPKVISNLGADADEASNAIDTLNGKLADFDKFNVLQGQSSNSDLEVTDALNKLLQEQIDLYDEQFYAMSSVANKANEMAKKIKEFFEPMLPYLDLIFDTIGNILDLLLPVVANIFEKLSPILAPIAKIVNDILKAVEVLLNLLTPIINMALDALNILTPILEIVHAITWALSIALSGALVAIFGILTPILFVFEAILKVVESIAEVVRALFQLDWASLGKNLSNIWSNWRTKDLVNGLNFDVVPKFADGGYTNANLIMTHENGKREWVGKAAGSSAIVNDTQMSDIMEVAVAKGVVLGNRALGSQESGGGVIHNHIYLDGKQIYEGITDTAKKYGKKWATV